MSRNPESAPGRALEHAFRAALSREASEMVDSLRAHRTTIGTLTVSESFEATQYHPYAAHYTVHVIQPGTYEVAVLSEYTHHVNGRATRVWDHYVEVECDSVIRMQSPDQERGGNRRGQATTHRFEVYSYTMPGELADGADSVEWLGGVFTPADGATFAACMTSPRMTGEPPRRYGTRPVVSL